MRILIIEDEHFAAKRMTNLIAENLPDAVVLDVLDSVEESVKWLASHVMPNLIFMDIQLADGLSFGIFDKVSVGCPVIFTTAYDQYALDAFRVNSIDYLLKPLEVNSFKRAIEKYQQFYQSNLDEINWSMVTNQMFNAKEKYKNRFLIKTGQSYSYLDVQDIKLIYSEDGFSFALKEGNKRLILDKTMDKISSQLDPAAFFRINRKYIVPLESIDKIHPYFNSRLKLELNFKQDQELIVSREKVGEFKNWLAS